MFFHLFSVAFLLHADARPIQVLLNVDGKMLRREPLDVARDDELSSELGASSYVSSESTSESGPSYALVDSEDLTNPAPPSPPGGSTCSAKNQVAYATLSDGLALIDMGPITTSGKTEVRRATSASDYKTFKEDAPIQTRLHASALDNEVGEWSFLADGADNILAVNFGLTDSGMTEVHRLKHGTLYQDIDLDKITILPRRNNSFEEWEFLLDSASNLVLIKKGPETPSGMTELHKMAATEGWEVFMSPPEACKPPDCMLPETGMHYSSSLSSQGDWTFLLDVEDNLICIRRPTAGDQSITVRRLTNSSNYQTFDLEDGGAILPHETDDDVHWVFQMDAQNNLLCIKEGPVTKEGYTEIHRLSETSNYKTFTLNEYSTALPCREPHFVGAAGKR